MQRRAFYIECLPDLVLLCAIPSVIRGLSAVVHNSETERKCCEELRCFVSTYLSLREVEKKALRQWGKPVSSVGLRKSVAQIMASNVSKKCKERYAGGAKERAQKNLKEGLTLSATDKGVLAGTACAWCGSQLPHTSLARGVESTYCSQTCAEHKVGWVAVACTPLLVCAPKFLS